MSLSVSLMRSVHLNREMLVGLKTVCTTLQFFWLDLVPENALLLHSKQMSEHQGPGRINHE